MQGFPLLWNDWQWFLHFEWERQTKKMYAYVETIESAFEKEEEAFSQWVATKEGSISEVDVESFGDACAAKFMALRDDFPALARQMAFCAVYGYFEHQLIHVCDALEVFRKLPSGVRAEKDRGIQRAKTYLKHTAEIPFPDNTPTWSKLVAYGKIRNLIMHNNSRVRDDGMAQFTHAATLTGGIPIDHFGRFTLSKGYILAAIDRVQEFFDLLVKVLPVETEEDRKEGLDSLMRALEAAGFSK